jgi:hypothetical protein
VPDFADDPKTELQRKAEQLRWVALIETVGYILLVTFWLIFPVTAARVIIGFLHGWITIAYWVMLVWIWPSMRWRWWWIPLGLAGPVGSILVADKIRRDGAPAGTKRAGVAVPAS